METPKKHILMIDDDPSTRRLFGGILAMEGFEVIYAKDGNEGREMARRFQPDLITLDFNLPIMDGITVVSYIKQEEQTKNIPIVFFTNADLSIEAEKNMRELGIADYMQKGVDTHEFIARIKKACGMT